MLEIKLNKCKKLGHFRSLKLSKQLIDFSSNDYLGLARCPRLAQLIWQECQALPLGSSGSRLLTGNSFYAQALEERIAAFHGYEAGLLFNCGYMANVGLLSALADESSTILFDAHVHASFYDGMRLGRACAFPFRHQDVDHLEQRLKSRRQGPCYICVESIYSMDGSQANLKDISRLAKQYQAHLIVDEAHATGVCGPEGRGLLAAYGLTNDVFAHVVTFGKAVGVHGAIVLGSRMLKEFLINFARPCLYTTALPFYALAAIKCAYDIFPQLEKERLHLRHLSGFFEGNSQTPIQPIFIKGNGAVQRASQLLAQKGFDVRALRSPTVQRGEERLRICLHTFNTEQEVMALLAYLNRLLTKH